FIGRDYGHTADYSEDTAAQIDDEIKSIVDSCHEKCRDLLSGNLDKLNAVANLLLEREKIEADEFEIVFNGGTVPPRKPKAKVHEEPKVQMVNGRMIIPAEIKPDNTSKVNIETAVEDTKDTKDTKDTENTKKV
ncbi:MAG: hypothetical protein RSC29_03870, partial [Oscillospiraceae bacterium]